MTFLSDLLFIAAIIVLFLLEVMQRRHRFSTVNLDSITTLEFSSNLIQRYEEEVVTVPMEIVEQYKEESTDLVPEDGIEDPVVLAHLSRMPKILI